MRCLITGGAGFIGSNLVRYLLGRGNEVLNVDALTYVGKPQFSCRSCLAIEVPDRTSRHRNRWVALWMAPRLRSGLRNAPWGRKPRRPFLDFETR